jgi:hypothetical protein
MTSDGGAGQSTSAGVLLDVGSMDEGEGPRQEGCEKVDFLFVIDNSGSMADDQQKLIASFPEFISTIQTTIQGQDHHIMVVSSDNNSACSSFCDLECQTGVDLYDCGNFCSVSVAFNACDDSTLGAGIVAPYCDQASNTDCGVQGDKRYLTSDQPDLAGTFSCIAKVGAGGDGRERPMAAMMAALTPGINGAGGCNEGFLRDDAILVVTIISDDPPFEPPAEDGGDDAGTEGSPQQWYDALVAAKGGNPDAVVVVGVVPKTGESACTYDGTPTPRFEQFVQMFGDRGILGSVCAGQYDPFFEAAVSTIDVTCDEFTPEG